MFCEGNFHAAVSQGRSCDGGMSGCGGRMRSSELSWCSCCFCFFELVSVVC